MVFQHFNLFPHLTVLENITIGPIQLKKIDKEVAEQKAHELLEKMGLADKADVYPNSFVWGTKTKNRDCALSSDGTRCALIR